VQSVAARAIALLALVAISAAGPAAGSAPIDPAASLDWQVVSRRPHDSSAFTQGLQLDGSGRLYESTGLLGHSTLREVDPTSGEVLRSVALPGDHFGEGLALVDDRLVQLTWRNGVATSWDAERFEALETYDYEGQGWGLCYDGHRLVMSDGSDQLTFRDPETFAVLGSVSVTSNAEPVARLNELECVAESVWANVWGSDQIVRIDPSTGYVDGVLDLAGVMEPDPAADDGKAVLNGIAYDAAADTLLVTGKRWPELIEIRVEQ
jgi:glutamine cyclotransferase